jgi:hypothetical protein
MLSSSVSQSAHRQFWRADAVSENDIQSDDLTSGASSASEASATAANPAEQHAQRLCVTIRDAIIGARATTNTAFGDRRITYCDYTASGRALSFIENYIIEEVLPTCVLFSWSPCDEQDLSSTNLILSLFLIQIRQYAYDDLHYWSADHIVTSRGSPADCTIRQLRSR